MKRMLFLLMTILLGMNVSFASDKESKKDAENMALYEQAVKAVKEKKFVVKYHTVDGRNRRLKLNGLTIFFMLNGNTTYRQHDDGRRFWGFSNGGFPNYESPKMIEGSVSDENVSIIIDAQGKVTCSILYKSDKGKVFDKVMEISFKKGSNECTVKWKSRGNKSTSWGTIHPICETEIRKAI